MKRWIRQASMIIVARPFIVRYKVYTIGMSKLQSGAWSLGACL